jgi:hypothetical protein
MVRVGKFTFFFHFSTGATLASLPRHFQSDFTLSADTFEQDHAHWIAFWPHATPLPKREEIWRTLFEKKENFRQKFLTVSAWRFSGGGEFVAVPSKYTTRNTQRSLYI